MYDLKTIMTRAWKLYRDNCGKISFAEALHRSWLVAKAESINESIVSNAKSAAGITEETDTWYGWKKRGYEVIHGSKCLFGCDLIYGSKGDGAIYKARFFGESQVQAIPA